MQEDSSEDLNAAAESENEATAEDLKTVQELQSEFESLKAERGTIGALRTLLGPDGVNPPKMRTIVQSVMNTAQKLVSALPGKSAVIEKYLDQSNVNLGASSPAQVFAGFLALADSFDDFTVEEMEQIRRVLHSSAPAGNAADLQEALKNGRGTKEITEIQRVEEPPGFGHFVEKEVVVGHEPIPFTKSDRYLLSREPLVTLYPDPAGSKTYRVEAFVANASDISFTVDIPDEGTIPEAAINNKVNRHLLRATFQNRNLRGVMDAWFGQGNSAMGAGGETDMASFGGNDLSQAITEMFLGHNSLQGNRFLTASELGQIAHDARWLVPGGDFGGTNKIDGQEAAQMMTALFGDNQTDITDNMARAHQFINSGGAEAPSFEGLYKSMYPDDTDFSRLTNIIGEKAVASLDLSPAEPVADAA